MNRKVLKGHPISGSAKGTYANWLKQAVCKTVTEKDTLWVQVPPCPQKKKVAETQFLKYDINKKLNRDQLASNRDTLVLAVSSEDKRTSGSDQTHVGLESLSRGWLGVALLIAVM